MRVSGKEAGARVSTQTQEQENLSSVIATLTLFRTRQSAASEQADRMGKRIGLTYWSAQ